jgi:hypothetical protein
MRDCERGIQDPAFKKYPGAQANSFMLLQKLSVQSPTLLPLIIAPVFINIRVLSPAKEQALQSTTQAREPAGIVMSLFSASGNTELGCDRLDGPGDCSFRMRMLSRGGRETAAIDEFLC